MKGAANDSRIKIGQGSGLTAPRPSLGSSHRADEGDDCQELLAKLNAGDERQLNELISLMDRRFRALAKKMFHNYPGVKRWARESDVYQSAMIRLLRSLREVKPKSTAELAGLMAQQLRRELIDLARHYYGRQGMGSNHESVAPSPSRDSAPVWDPVDTTNDLARLAAWCEFHHRAENLPPEERQVFDLIWYQGMTQAETAAALGITERTVWKRWQAARLRLNETANQDLLNG